jgi:hypothetical protein
VCSSDLTPETFTGGGGSAPGFTGSQSYDVLPGTYTVTEVDLPADWVLYSSVDQAGVEHLGQAAVQVTVGDGDTATIYFYNYKAGAVSWPVPELPAAVLLSLGLLGLGGFLLFRKFRLENHG